jgi:hypothetical protein
MHKRAFMPAGVNPLSRNNPKRMLEVPRVTHFIEECSRLYISGNLIKPRQPKKSKAKPITIKT